MVEQALGRSIAQQKQNIDNTWKSVGDTAGMVGGYGMSGGFAKTGNTGGYMFDPANTGSGMNEMQYHLDGGQNFNPNFRRPINPITGLPYFN
jgi:hypothetical protein